MSQDPSQVQAQCLVVDDDGQVRRALARAIESMGLPTIEAAHGKEALELLGARGEVAVCISDIYMPEMDGVTLLKELQSRYPDTGVIMLTGAAEVSTAVECLQLGALDYLSKPVLVDEVRARVQKALEKRDLILQNRFYQRHLESRVRELDRLNRQRLVAGIQMLVEALEAKDAYTRGHSRRVSEYAVKTAVRLGITGDQLEQIRLGGELHDIGKIGTREAVLNKPGPLSEAEFQHIRDHCTLGERILAPFLRDAAAVLRIVRSHHERFDGRGFPDGLAGDAIPLEARIVACVDAFDAMTTNRAYRAPRAPLEAVEELRRGSGRQFDPAVVDAFLAAFPEPPDPSIAN